MRALLFGALVMAAAAIIGCDDDYVGTRPGGGIQETGPTSPGSTTAHPDPRAGEDTLVTLVGAYHSTEDSCFYLIQAESDTTELAFSKEVPPPDYQSGTMVAVTGRYATRLGTDAEMSAQSFRLGSRCLAGPILDVVSINRIDENTESEAEITNQ